MPRSVACAAVFFFLSCVPAVAGPVTLLSKADPARPSGTAGGSSEVLGVSADGRYVILLSNADNLLSGMVKAHTGKDLFFHDRIAGTTVLVDHEAGDPAATGNAEVLGVPVLSADGRWVAFRSSASDLVAGQVDQAPNPGSIAAPDIFLWDRDSGVTILVSHRAGLATTAAGGCAGFGEISFSANGSRVAFLCGASDLMAGQSDGVLTDDVFLYDRAAGTNSLVTHASGSATTSAGGSNPAVSADGSWVAFLSFTANLVAGQVDTNGSRDVFLYDTTTGANVLVSHAAGSAVTAGNFGLPGFFDLTPQISADGSRIAYVSPATNLVAGQTDGNSDFDVFLYDRAAGTNALVSHTLSSATTAANEGSSEPVLSSNGQYVVFRSFASDLVAGAASLWIDVFVYERVSGTNIWVSRQGATPAQGHSFSPRVSSDGAWIAFLSYATNLVAGQTDTPSSLDVFLWSRASGSIRLVTRSTGSATTAAGGNAGDPHINADGSWIALASDSAGLTGGIDDFNALPDVFLYERATEVHHLITSREGAVSATAGGRIADRARTVMSNDGRYVAFTSAAPNLPGITDGNNQLDVFLHDRVSGTNRLVSHASGSLSTTGNAVSHDPLVSTDGSTVVFESSASDLVSGSGPAFSLGQLYLYARDNGAITLVSHTPSSPSTPAFGGVEDGHYAVSGDGRWIAYAFSGSLIDGQVDGNTGADVFLFDRATGTNTLVSHASSSPAQTGNGTSSAPSISADGRYVAFESSASDLVPGQAGAGRIFLYDRIAGTTTRVSSSGASPLAISADGRQVVFTSMATDVVPGQVDTNSNPDVFLWDRDSGSTLLVSRTPASPATTGNSRSDLGTFALNAPVLSADGRWVAFSSFATNLISGQTGQTPALYLFDRIAGTVTLVSRSAASPNDRRTASEPAVSADGRFVAFSSTADDLVPGQVDRGFSLNYFLHDRIAGTTALASHIPSSDVTSGALNASGVLVEAARVSADGAWVAFHSPMTDLAADDHDGTNDVFLYANLLPGRDFFTLPPCRILDTRQAGQGPALTSGERRTVAAHGNCGIPATARTLAVNVTVVQPSEAGFLTFHAGDLAPETTSTINFGSGQLRSNNAVLPLSFDGRGLLAVTPVLGVGTVHLIVDVSGWFE